MSIVWDQTTPQQRLDAYNGDIAAIEINYVKLNEQKARTLGRPITQKYTEQMRSQEVAALVDQILKVEGEFAAAVADRDAGGVDNEGEPMFLAAIAP